MVHIFLSHKPKTFLSRPSGSNSPGPIFPISSILSTLWTLSYKTGLTILSCTMTPSSPSNGKTTGQPSLRIHNHRVKPRLKADNIVFHFKRGSAVIAQSLFFVSRSGPTSRDGTQSTLLCIYSQLCQGFPPRSLDKKRGPRRDLFSNSSKMVYSTRVLIMVPSTK